MQNQAWSLFHALGASFLRLACVATLCAACTATPAVDEPDAGSGAEADAEAALVVDGAANDAENEATSLDAASSQADAGDGSAGDLDASDASSRDAGSAGATRDGAASDAQAALDANDAGSATADGASGAEAGSDAAASTPERPLLGAYCGNSVDALKQFESWLGRPVDGILGYTGNASWEDFDGSVGWATGLWSAIDRRVFWSVPLIAAGATLAQAGAGAYDEHYRKAAQTLASYRPQDPQLYIRTGWEFNGDWFPWSAQGKPADFVAAFQRFVTVFRSVSTRFVFEWNVNVGDVGMDPESAYPGDAYVDIIGMDFYWNTEWEPADAQAAWKQKLDEPWGLQWHQTFAKAHGKPTSYSEWGIRSNAAAYYIQQAELWFNTHPVLFHSYWNANVDFPGKLSDDQYPDAGAAYKTAFGP